LAEHQGQASLMNSNSLVGLEGVGIDHGSHSIGGIVKTVDSFLQHDGYEHKAQQPHRCGGVGVESALPQAAIVIRNPVIFNDQRV